jgi:energy-coupling factor transporter ATP-binding protein EcfA2
MDFVKKHIVQRFRDPKHAKLAATFEELQEPAPNFETLPPVCGPVDGMYACTLGKDVLSDLEMFSNYRQSEVSPVLFDALDKTHFQGSKAYLRALLSAPIKDTALLRERQALLKSRLPHSAELSSKLKDLVTLEADVCWLFAKKDDHVQALEDMLYFRWMPLRPLNKMPKAITAINLYRIVVSPVIGILSPIMYFVIPYLIIRMRYKIKIDFMPYLRIMLSTSKMLFETSGWTSRLRLASYVFSLVFYFQGIFNSVEISQTLFRLNRFVLEKIQGVSAFFENANKVLGEYYTPDIANKFYNMQSVYSPMLGIPSSDRQRFWMASNFGAQLAFIKNIDKDHAKSLVHQMYMLDTVGSVLSLHVVEGFAFTSIVTSEGADAKPQLSCGGVWHPSITGSVRNSVHLTPQSNVVLTGPNAGGKSTLVKSVLLASVLAQTITLVNAGACALTPFAFINSQISIPDCKGKESLFEAEMNRCKGNLEAINSLGAGDYAFIVMDEIFNSTNPIEGISGAYAVAKAITAGEQALLLFTTHYHYLTKLGKKTKRFKNFKMNVERDADTGGFVFPYKLSKGVSKQYIALELLEANGFLPEVISEARQVRDSQTRGRKPSRV